MNSCHTIIVFLDWRKRSHRVEGCRPVFTITMEHGAFWTLIVSPLLRRVLCYLLSLLDCTTNRDLLFLFKNLTRHQPSISTTNTSSTAPKPAAQHQTWSTPQRIYRHRKPGLEFELKLMYRGVSRGWKKRIKFRILYGRIGWTWRPDLWQGVMILVVRKWNTCVR